MADSSKSKRLKMTAVTKNSQSWRDLPPQLLGLIFLRLGFKDRCTLTSVCKSWHLFNPSLSDFSSICESPSLMIPHKQDGWLKLFHPISNNHHSLNLLDIPELINAKVLFSNFGWLLICSTFSDDPMMFFFNPFTRQKLKVPPYTATSNRALFDNDFSFTPTLISGSFSLPPTHSNCLISVIYGTSSLEMIGRATLYFGRRDKYWYYKSVLPFMRDIMKDIVFTSYPILNDGRIYYMDKYGHVIIFPHYGMFVEVYFIMKYVPPTGKKVVDCYMLHVGGEGIEPDHEEIYVAPKKVERYPNKLLLSYSETTQEELVPYTDRNVHEEFLGVFVVADINDDSRCALVEKLDLDFGVKLYDWRLVSDLGNRCVFIGNNGSFLVEAGEGRGDANTIYFSYGDDGENSVSYSLSTQGNFINCSSKKFRGTWIKPSTL